MIAKILAGVLGVAVVSLGGYTYWAYAMQGSGSGCCPFQSRQTQVPVCGDTEPCCQQLSRCEDVPTKCIEPLTTPTATVPDVDNLTIQPREVE